MGTLKPQSNGPLYSNTVIGTLAVDGGLLHLVHLVRLQRGGPGQATAPPSPLLAVPNVTAHPSTASAQWRRHTRCVGWVGTHPPPVRKIQNIFGHEIPSGLYVHLPIVCYSQATRRPQASCACAVLVLRFMFFKS